MDLEALISKQPYINNCGVDSTSSNPLLKLQIILLIRSK